MSNTSDVGNNKLQATAEKSPFIPFASKIQYLTDDIKSGFKICWIPLYKIPPKFIMVAFSSDEYSAVAAKRVIQPLFRPLFRL